MLNFSRSYGPVILMGSSSHCYKENQVATLLEYKNITVVVHCIDVILYKFFNLFTLSMEENTINNFVNDYL